MRDLVNTKCERCPYMVKGIFPYCNQRFRTINIEKDNDRPIWCPLKKG